MEGLVGYARRNFLVPVPRLNSWEELNAQLLEGCRKRRERKLWGHTETIVERFQRDREKLLPLPPTEYEACQKRTTRASSQALVRYETNDYSVPAEHGHQQVLVKAFVWEMVISCSSEVIARHSRSYGREELIFNPLHYLALLEQKSNALDQAAPLEGWDLPEEFWELRRQMEARLGKRGRREYVQVLRLLETFSLVEVAAGVRQALRFPAISFDAVKHLVLCALEQRPPRLDLENYPHLPLAQVALTRAADYQVLLREAVCWTPLAYCWSITSSNCGCRPWCASFRNWASNAPKKAPRLNSFCCAWASRRCWTGSGALRSGAFARRGFP